jgi:hypothetical protein
MRLELALQDHGIVLTPVTIGKVITAIDKLVVGCYDTCYHFIQIYQFFLKNILERKTIQGTTALPALAISHTYIYKRYLRNTDLLDDK